MADEPARLQLSLDGPWQFKLDPQNEGVAGQWFAREATFPDKIMVPGNWQAQGFGERSGIARHGGIPRWATSRTTESAAPVPSPQIPLLLPSFLWFRRENIQLYKKGVHPAS